MAFVHNLEAIVYIEVTKISYKCAVRVAVNWNNNKRSLNGDIEFHSGTVLTVFLQLVKKKENYKIKCASFLNGAREIKSENILTCRENMLSLIRKEIVRIAS